MRDQRRDVLVLMLAMTLAGCASGGGTGEGSGAQRAPGTEAGCRTYAQPNMTGVSPPRRLSGEQPDPSQLAVKSGYACVRVTISPSGSVIDPQVVQTDNDEFARALVRALGDWQYEPATRGTAKVPYHTVVFARLPG